MDVQVAALLSLGEVLLWARLQGTLDWGVSGLVLVPLFSRFAMYFAFQYALLKFYRVVLYHRFFSPLRHVPGPKVSSRDSLFVTSLLPLAPAEGESILLTALNFVFFQRTTTP
jgi:hypothetical protein